MTKSDTNRQNAQHSTGPRTEAGKNRSRLNSLKHGLTAKTLIIPAEDAHRYQTHLKRFINDYNPRNTAEAFLTQTLAEISWSLSEINGYLQNHIAQIGQNAEIPFETTDPTINIALAHAMHTPEIIKLAELLSRYERRKLRAFRETLTQLTALQAVPLPKPAPKSITQNDLTNPGFVISETAPTPTPQPETTHPPLNQAA